MAYEMLINEFSDIKPKEEDVYYTQTIRNCGCLSCPSDEYIKKVKEITAKVNRIMSSVLWEKIISEEEGLGAAIKKFIEENFVQYYLSGLSCDIL